MSLRRQDSEGAKLADLPIEQATKFEFVPDLKDRQALGPRCADATLLRADEVIRTLLRCMSLQMAHKRHYQVQLGTSFSERVSRAMSKFGTFGYSDRS